MEQNRAEQNRTEQNRTGFGISSDALSLERHDLSVAADMRPVVGVQEKNLDEVDCDVNTDICIDFFTQGCT